MHYCLSVLTALVLSFVFTISAQAQDPRTLGFGDFEPISGDWSEEGGVITGHATDGLAVLSTRDALADFELTVSFRADAANDAGLWVRAHWLPTLPASDGAAPADLPRHLVGYRILSSVVDPEQTAAVTDTSSGAILTMVAPKALETFKAGDWNEMSVVAIGDIIEIKLNGVIAARLQDEAFIGGHIAFMVAPSDGMLNEIAFRDCTLRDLGRTGSWRKLFDGKTLTGWKNWGEEEWAIEEGVLIGRSGPKKSEGYLCTVETWKDFRVRGTFQMLGEGNFGLFYHASIALRPEDNYPIITGVQGEVEPSWPGATGWHYESYGRGWIFPPDHASIGAWALRPGEWNEIEIRSVGNHITTWVNGIRATDFHDAGHRIFEGGFALQLHAGGVDGIAWRDVQVEE